MTREEYLTWLGEIKLTTTHAHNSHLSAIIFAIPAPYDHWVKALRIILRRQHFLI